MNFGPLAAEILSLIWGTPDNFNGFRILAALLHGTLVMGVSQTLRRSTQGATYIRQGGHHVGHWPTFLVENHARGVYAETFTGVANQWRGYRATILKARHSEGPLFRELADPRNNAPHRGVQQYRSPTESAVKAKFHYATWSQTVSKLVADLQRELEFGLSSSSLAAT